MNREEAMQKLIEVLDENAEFIRNAPRIHYLCTQVRDSSSGHRRTRQFIRFFVVEACPVETRAALHTR